jgi:hypothetical protein
VGQLRIRAGAWIAKRRGQLALILRFGPMTVRAYAAVLRVIVTERLWHVASHTRPDLAPLNRYEEKGALS